MMNELFIIPAVVFLILIGLVRKSRPAKNKRGKRLNNAAEKTIKKDTFTVATFNIQTGKDLHGKRDINRSAKAIRHADLIGIQEVYAPSWLNKLGFGLSQSRVLADTGGFGWLFCATRTRWLREHRGNLLLSKLPVSEWRIKMLPDQSGKSFRNMTVAKLSWKGEAFYFINTHLHTRKGRRRQLDVVLREFAKYPRAILVGDFNTMSNSKQMIKALKDAEISDAIDVALLDTDNDERIDWILTKGFQVHDGSMIAKGISDHPYYQVTLSID